MARGVKVGGGSIVLGLLVFGLALGLLHRQARPKITYYTDWMTSNWNMTSNGNCAPRTITTNGNQR